MIYCVFGVLKGEKNMCYLYHFTRLNVNRGSIKQIRRIFGKIL